ncbi:enoyl-CoA hydratase/isomerase family protein [Salinimicrobium sediminilitoris]|uniref:enoyl-CoA hydratase/isomerase family protein n=1 Tax=Salinimicrobium sediminilitoris TaxID=2876715 RepID=UPI001E5AD772|nr:enoyl-CoA hydratase/isomerase family protein [Salinimicrobium sediminilitoris]MCC8359461.1 enoyl-CoA hydratase/isomerase family protein [Salinimicrobium sediminilitoris]
MTTTRENGSLYTNVHNGIASLEFGHPASNSFPGVLLERLTKELEKLSEDEEVKVIILKSEGEKAFCAGASFDELLAVENMQQGKVFFSGFANVINAMRSCKKLIIGRIHGKTVGGGVGLAAACDYCFATEQAAIKLSELSIGIGPFVIAPAVERKMGVAALAELTLAAQDWKNAYWAQEKGLYARVFDSIEEMDRELEFFAEKLASYNPAALEEMKKVLWEGTQKWDSLLQERAAISGELVLSEFTRYALSKFRK